MMNEHTNKLNALRNECIARLVELVKEKGKFYENTGNYIVSTFLPNINLSVSFEHYAGEYEEDFVLRMVYESDKDILLFEPNNSDLTYIGNLSTDDIVKACEFMEVINTDLIEKMEEYDREHFLP